MTIGIICSPGSELARASKIAITPLPEPEVIAITPLPEPEVIAGSMRLKAGIATNLVLNLLTT